MFLPNWHALSAAVRTRQSDRGTHRFSAGCQHASCHRAPMQRQAGMPSSQANPGSCHSNRIQGQESWGSNPAHKCRSMHNPALALRKRFDGCMVHKPPAHLGTRPKHWVPQSVLMNYGHETNGCRAERHIASCEGAQSTDAIKGEMVTRAETPLHKTMRHAMREKECNLHKPCAKHLDEQANHRQGKARDRRGIDRGVDWPSLVWIPASHRWSKHVAGSATSPLALASLNDILDFQLSLAVPATALCRTSLRRLEFQSGSCPEHTVVREQDPPQRSAFQATFFPPAPP